MMRAFVLVFCKCLESIPYLTSSPSAQLCRGWTLAHVEECIRIVRTLVPSTLAATFDEITGILLFFHSLVEVDFPLFVDDFHLEKKVILD
jgi:hypothetical protein